MNCGKSQKERLEEMLNIYIQLGDLGIDENICPNIAKFKAAANLFIKDGVGDSGKVQLTEINRVLHYTLSTQPQVISSARLVMLGSRQV